MGTARARRGIWLSTARGGCQRADSVTIRPGQSLPNWASHYPDPSVMLGQGGGVKDQDDASGYVGRILLIRPLVRCLSVAWPATGMTCW